MLKKKWDPELRIYGKVFSILDFAGHLYPNKFVRLEYIADILKIDIQKVRLTIPDVKDLAAKSKRLRIYNEPHIGYKICNKVSEAAIEHQKTLDRISSHFLKKEIRERYIGDKIDIGELTKESPAIAQLHLASDLCFNSIEGIIKIYGDHLGKLSDQAKLEKLRILHSMARPKVYD